MQNYHWEGIDTHGQRVKGDSTARDPTQLKVNLRKQGITPLRISLKRTRTKKIRSHDITLFSRQLATMLTSGIPLIQTLELIIRGQTHSAMKTLLSQIKTDIENGSALSDALRQHPENFNNLFCNLVYVGEQSGTLDTLLKRIATYQEKMESIKSKVKKALFYPSIVMIVSILITAVLLIFVVPQFETLFKNFGAELPIMTKIVIQISRFVQTYWWILFSLLILLCYGIHYLYRINFFDRLILRLPIVGSILKKAIIARFARTLSTTFAAGLPLIDALQAVSGITDNSLFTKAILYVREEISKGQSMQHALQKALLFPPMVVQMIAIGEESGTLDNMLSKVADFYEDEVEHAVDNLSSLLEPFILVILGSLVGGLVIAMYLPIFKLGSVI